MISASARPTPTLASAGTDTIDTSIGVHFRATLQGPVNRPSRDTVPALTVSQTDTLARTEVVFSVPDLTLLKILSASASVSNSTSAYKKCKKAGV